MLGVQLGDGVQRIRGRIGAAACGQGVAFKSHALFERLWEQVACGQKDALFVVIAKGIFGLQVQLHTGTGAVALQRLFNARQQVIAAHQKFHRRVQHVQRFAQSVFEHPGQGNHALIGDFHRASFAQ